MLDNAIEKKVGRREGMKKGKKEREGGRKGGKKKRRSSYIKILSIILLCKSSSISESLELKILFLNLV